MARPLKVAGPIGVEPSDDLLVSAGPAICPSHQVLEKVALPHRAHRDRKVRDALVRRERVGEGDKRMLRFHARTLAILGHILQAHFG